MDANHCQVDGSLVWQSASSRIENNRIDRKMDETKFHRRRAQVSFVRPLGKYSKILLIHRRTME